MMRGNSTGEERLCSSHESFHYSYANLTIDYLKKSVCTYLQTYHNESTSVHLYRDNQLPIHANLDSYFLSFIIVRGYYVNGDPAYVISWSTTIFSLQQQVYLGDAHSCKFFILHVITSYVTNLVSINDKYW